MSQKEIQFQKVKDHKHMDDLIERDGLVPDAEFESQLVEEDFVPLFEPLNNEER